LILSVPDEGYSRNVSCALIYVFITDVSVDMEAILIDYRQ